MKVVKVADKAFIGKDIIHIAVFKKNDERTTYNMIYLDGKSIGTRPFRVDEEKAHR